MAANYPNSYDFPSDPGSTLAGPPLHSAMHNQLNDIIEAMQAEMGLTPSGSSVSIASRLDSLPRGVVPGGYTTNTTPTGSGLSSTMADVGPSVAFTAIAGRLYRVTVSVACAYNNGSANENALLSAILADGSNTRICYVAGLMLGAGSTTVGAYASFSFSKTFTHSGSHVIKLRASSSHGSNPIVFQWQNQESTLIVEDIGAA